MSTILKWHDTQPESLDRIIQLDVLRGLAVLGIYWINIVVFAMPSGSYSLPTMVGEAEQLNLLTWIASELFIEGTMRGLFSILFGASAMVFLNKISHTSDGIEVIDRYYRRSLLLILFGLFHAYILLWPYDVLYAYGVLGLLLFPLRRVSPVILLVAGCILLIIGENDFDYTKFSGETKSVSKPIQSSQMVREVSESLRTADDENSLQILRETMDLQKQNDIEIYHSGYLHILKSQISDVVEQQSTQFYLSHVFDIGGMMLIGMALFRIGVFTGRYSNRFYLFMMLSGYLLGVLPRAYNIHSDIIHDFSLIEYTHLSYNLGRLPVTLGHIGLIILLCKSGRLRWLVKIFAVTGRMALTNYILQTVISIFLFYGFGLKLFSEFERYQLAFICLAVWFVQIIFSRFWLNHFRQGPLEWLWRCLIYKQLLPFRAASQHQ